MSEVISSFRSLRAGSQVFALLIVFLCVVFHTMWSGKSLQLLCILPSGMLCLSAISMMIVKIRLAVCMLVGMIICAKADSVSSQLSCSWSPNDTAYKRWNCHSGHKLLSNLGVRSTVFTFEL